MSGERILPRKVHVGETNLISTTAVRGITPSGEFSSEKRTVVRETMTYILPLMRIDGTDKLKPRDDSGLLPYRTPTSFGKRLIRKESMVRQYVASYFTTDQSDQYFQDNAELFRGMTLGDILVAAIVNDGRVVSDSPYQFTDAPVVTQATTDRKSAAGYAEKKTHDDVTAKRILYALQLDTLGLSVADVMGSILMSPVVVRFIPVPEERADGYGMVGIAPEIAQYAQTTALPYFAAVPPFHVAEETTERWAEKFAGQFGFDVRNVYAFAQSLEQRHLGDS